MVRRGKTLCSRRVNCFAGKKATSDKDNDCESKLKDDPLILKMKLKLLWVCECCQVQNLGLIFRNLDILFSKRFFDDWNLNYFKNQYLNNTCGT